MKIINLFIILFILCCTTQENKIYICGDHPCKNKNEINDYFNNNISVEVYVVESKKKKIENANLVDLNLYKESKNKQNKKDLSFLKDRKSSNINTNQDNKYSKLKMKVLNKKVDKKEIQTDIRKNTEKTVSKPKKSFKFGSIKTTEIVHLCKNLDECDINVISKKINEMANKKSFPDINY